MSIRWQAWRLALALAALAKSADFSFAADPPAAGGKLEVVVTEDVEYGTGGGEKLLLDQALPQGLTEPAPGIVFIHGGGWAGGRKKDFGEPMRQYAAQGFVSVSISYRLAPQHPFPAQIEDCKCAVRWLRAHAEELHLDPQRIGAIGASAGGHLVMMLGTMDPDDGLEGEGGWPDQSSKVQSVVSFFGPTNLVGEWPEFTTKILVNFLGGTAADKPDVYRQASPVTYVSKGDAPMLLYQGTKDSLVPGEQAWQMAEAMSAAGVPGRVELLIGRDHGWGGTELIRTFLGTAAFFNETLRPPAN